jgi:hypothetical protein
VFLLKHLFNLCPFGKCLSIKLRNSLITLVLTDLLNGRLKYITFRGFLFLFLEAFSGFWYVKFTFRSSVALYLYPLVFSFGILLPKLFWSTVRKNCYSIVMGTFKIGGWRLRIFENSERSVQFLKQNVFLTCSWRFFQIYIRTTIIEIVKKLENGFQRNFMALNLKSLHIAHRRLFDLIDILLKLTVFGYFDPPWVGAVLFSHTCQVSPKDYIKATLKAEGRYYSFLGPCVSS